MEGRGVEGRFSTYFPSMTGDRKRFRSRGGRGSLCKFLIFKKTFMEYVLSLPCFSLMQKHMFSQLRRKEHLWSTCSSLSTVHKLINICELIYSSQTHRKRRPQRSVPLSAPTQGARQGAAVHSTGKHAAPHCELRNVTGCCSWKLMKGKTPDNLGKFQSSVFSCKLV
ncbi:hypothetical protein HJG60_008776 [Phyllostomus discolor]|uniref:Uncharacterized protein n=1 Tax=Phyllostomus discolor TaxID=89673 RepID=A0A834DL35_9CHIR|nr:hypothetical protein HJG60_008776 [Phyllostomus discolor]